MSKEMLLKKRLLNSLKQIAKFRREGNFMGKYKPNQNVNRQNKKAISENIEPLNDITIKKTVRIPINDYTLKGISFRVIAMERIDELVTAFSKVVSNGCTLLKGYPTMFINNKRGNFLVDFYGANFKLATPIKHDTYYSYSNNQVDPLSGKRPKSFIFKLPDIYTAKELSGLVSYIHEIKDMFITCINNNSFQAVDSSNKVKNYNVSRSDAVDAYDILFSQVDVADNFIEFFLKNGLVPMLNENETEIFDTLKVLYEKDYIDFIESKIIVDWSKSEEIFKALNLDITTFSLPKGRNNEIKLEEFDYLNILNEVLLRDTIRADIKSYDAMMLQDPNRGSWELWDAPLHSEELVAFDVGYYARDPRMDIVESGIVGIDFGTKSTVVVAQDDSDNIVPMRIGMGRYEKQPTLNDYENPTVMEFIDIETFLSAYTSGEGRPMTRWADVTSSHTAYNDWQENDKSEHYFSFLGELKQWAGDSKRTIRIRDKKGKEINLPAYDDLQENDLDPIELYAYYIGLYINNMHTKKIYMEYILSFPVTYSLKTRTNILESFRKGLSRSLPQTILLDPSCMERFSVEQGVGEPAAYAVCALKAYNMKPSDQENIVYGIFDFGGGTTDFDYGVWRKGKGAKERRFSNVIEHFGDGGDKFLGGENLLELLSYEVFKNNQEKLRSAEITFSKPSECHAFPGSEFLLADSQEAHTNMRQLMEKLRPIWERHDEYLEQYSSGVVKLRLFTRQGEMLNNFELNVDISELETILRNRIQRGVDDFFNGVLNLYNKAEYMEVLKNTNKIHIFLAGNSSKSEILREAFDTGIKKCIEKLNSDGGTQFSEDIFEIYPPLGTAEADQKIKSLCGDCAEINSLDKPTGKTGVAIGLVQCRKGSKIKVISERKAEEEIKFRYWVGYCDDDDYITPCLSPSSAYNEWVEYLDAGVDRFEFYYTTSNAADLLRGMNIKDAKKSRHKIPAEAVNEDWLIYLRPVGPNKVEFAVAINENAFTKGEFIYGPVAVELK